LKKNFLKLFITLTSFLLFSYFLDANELFNRTSFYIFQLRDLERARSLLSGHLIFFGPEMTGGGNLPGPLYYIMLAIALFVKTNWKSAWVMQYVLAFFASIAGANYLSSSSKWRFGFLWFILFICSPATFLFLSFFLNVSSLLIFVVASLILINKTFFDDLPVTRTRSFLLACFVIGLGTHFHLSIIVLILALFFMQIFAKKLQLSGVPKKSFFFGIIVFILPLIPYFTWLIFSRFGIFLGQSTPYVGEAHKSITNIVSLLQFAEIPINQQFLMGIGVKIIRTVPVPLFFIILAKSLEKINKNYIKSSDKICVELRPLTICLIFSLIPYLDWYFSAQAVRYVVPFYICLIFITVLLFQHMLKSELAKRQFNLIAGISIFSFWIWFILNYPQKLIIKYFISVFALMLLTFIFDYLTGKNDWRKDGSTSLSFILVILISHSEILLKDFKNFDHSNYASSQMPKYYEWESIWKSIYTDSSWNYEEAKKRIYYVGHHLEQSPQLFLEGFQNRPEAKSKTLPDGYFVSNLYRIQNNKWPSDFTGKYIPSKDWLLSQNLQPEVSIALRNGDIELGKNISKKILILPYWVKNTKNVPQFFHNIGQGYMLTKEDLQLNLIHSKEGVVKIAKDQYLFKWNETSNQDKYFSTGATVFLTKNLKNNYNVSVKVVGGTISQTSPWISPDWTQAWIAPYIEITCGKKIQKFLISKSIGFRREGSFQTKSPLLSGNNSFVAPFERSFAFVCDRAINNLKLGRESSTVETIRKVLVLPPKVLSVSL
jgi:hypothetical protein